MGLAQTWPGGRVAAAAFGLGAVMALGQAPLGFWWATLGGLSGLIWLVGRRVGASPAFWTGLFGGAGYFALALSWIVEPFLIDAARFGWMAPFAVVLLSFGLALFWGVAAALSAGARQRALGFAVALAAVEALRGVVLTGFPWAQIGHVWIGTPLDQLAAFAGANGLTLLTTLAAALPLVWGWRGAGSAVVVLGAVAGAGQMRLNAPLPDDRAVTLRLVQPNAEQELKWDADRARLYFVRQLDLTRTEPVADVTIWPETALPYIMEYSPEVAPQIAAASGGRAVILGIQRAEGDRFWNSMRVIGPEGLVMAQYDKHHLVPFGEYIPFGDLAGEWFGLTAFAAQTGNTYSDGPGPAVLDLGRFGKVLPLICYEAVFPLEVNAAPERADWILQITNDAWFGVWTGPFQHAAQARLRAVEQGLPLVRVANTGLTEVVNARGRVVAELPFGTIGALDAVLPGALAPTLYSRFGEVPVLLLLAGLAVLTLARVQTAAH
ncbi:apolipoprotein N-acyltransferase [Tabrizicola sp.]|uniref:apolipoprotein N-acyltransferase n=1 Tax=Tabrizicola sp. TaxID=2005166 RepID=UPI00286B7D38|nr:apolipoprotein N-acyltransferase [Tabrizicola sp.]